MEFCRELRQKPNVRTLDMKEFPLTLYLVSIVSLLAVNVLLLLKVS